MCKAELLELLSPVEPSEDWRLFYEEWAAIAEHDGERSRPEAEHVAFKRCVGEWKRRHPPATGRSTCAGCGRPLEPSGKDAVPLADGAWIHWGGRRGESCWRAWCDRRQVDAVAALAAAGIVDPLAGAKHSEP